MSRGERAPRYLAITDALRFPGGSAEQIVIDPISGQVHVLSAEQESALAACRGQRPLDEHAAAAAQRLGRPLEAMRGLLLSLVVKGLLLEEGALRTLVRGAEKPASGIQQFSGGGARVTGGAPLADGEKVRGGELVTGGAPLAEREKARGGELVTGGAAHLATLGVPTKGRAPGLVACVRGHAAAARERGRRVTTVVADSSAGGDLEAARGAWEALGEAGGAVRHAGLSQRVRFVPVLAGRAGVDPAVAMFALVGDERLGSDTGANRNALLLDSAGEPLLMTDDDVRARAVRSPGANEREVRAALALWSGDPFEAWFADPDEPIVREEAWETPDTFALHEALLGQDVARAILRAEEAAHATSSVAVGGRADGAGDPAAGGARAEESVSAAGSAGLDVRAAGVFFQRLARRGGRVVTTQLGCAGDHGMGASFSMLLFGGASRGRLLASEGRFEDAFTRRRILRSVAAPTISDTSFCMSMSLGVDARELVPPFAPSGRNADGLFGALVRACVADSFTAFLPWAVEHAPARARTASFEDERSFAGRGELNDFVRLALGVVLDPRGGSTARHLAEAGEALVLLAARPHDLEHLLREQTMRAGARRLVQIERALAEHGRRPAFWARALDGFASAMRAGLAHPAAHLPLELVRAHGEAAARELLLRYLGDVGRLLAAWPALFEAARELRARGVRLSEPLAAAQA